MIIPSKGNNQIIDTVCYAMLANRPLRLQARIINGLCLEGIPDPAFQGKTGDRSPGNPD